MQHAPRLAVLRAIDAERALRRDVGRELSPPPLRQGERQLGRLFVRPGDLSDVDGEAPGPAGLELRREAFQVAIVVDRERQDVIAARWSGRLRVADHDGDPGLGAEVASIEHLEAVARSAREQHVHCGARDTLPLRRAELRRERPAQAVLLVSRCDMDVTSVKHALRRQLAGQLSHVAVRGGRIRREGDFLPAPV